MAVMTKTPKGEDIVILSKKEYNGLVAAAGEDAKDAATAKRILARIKDGNEDLLTSKEVDALLAAKTPLAFWRKKRGLSQEALARSVGIAQGFISEIEAGKKAGDIATLKGIAGALRISLDDLVA
jgi:DNA-binding XRE family transcriptional regulator